MFGTHCVTAGLFVHVHLLGKGPNTIRVCHDDVINIDKRLLHTDALVHFLSYILLIYVYQYTFFTYLLKVGTASLLAAQHANNGLVVREP